MVLGALGYLIDSYGNILLPNYEAIFGVIVGVTAVIGELPFFLWLLIRGVNVQEWHNRASPGGCIRGVARHLANCERIQSICTPSNG
jgi:hypothetical protein